MGVQVNFNDVTGKIKPMHCVNNGPKAVNGAEQIRGNFEEFKEAEIPYVRNHDASFCADYGGEHTVDVHAIFPDFSRNPDDESAYDFTYTDEYTENIIKAGSQVFYRLGSKIEHGIKKYGTLVPPDFEKWARICEHIIRHYNEGWADGFYYNIIYWEIWNEADGVQADGNQPNWQGTPEQFFDLYTVASKHLKKCFPDLKIGGPAVSCLSYGDWTDNFLAKIAAEKAPLDFFTWHTYGINPSDVAKSTANARRKLDAAGFTETENICNEWNYVEGWTDKWVASLAAMQSIRGAAYMSAIMSSEQKTSLDMLMYYDARIGCGMNGMFDSVSLRPIKGYFAIKMFSELYKLGAEVQSSADEGLYVAAAVNGGKKAMIITHYSPDKNVGAEWVEISADGLDSTDKLRSYLVDDAFGMYESRIKINDGKIKLFMQPDSFVLITNYCINE